MAAFATIQSFAATGIPGRMATGKCASMADRAVDLDTSLVERCLGGEETAWEDLVKLHTRRVYSICYRFTGSDAEAQSAAPPSERRTVVLIDPVILDLDEDPPTVDAGPGEVKHVS